MMCSGATIKINGVDVDADDPCALAAAFYTYRMSLIAGGGVEELEIRSPITNRRVRFSKANLADLDAEIARLSAACDVAKGIRRRRTRYAIRGTHLRPY